MAEQGQVAVKGGGIQPDGSAGSQRKGGHCLARIGVGQSQTVRCGHDGHLRLRGLAAGLGLDEIGAGLGSGSKGVAAQLTGLTGRREGHRGSAVLLHDLSGGVNSGCGQLYALSAEKHDIAGSDGQSLDRAGCSLFRHQEKRVADRARRAIGRTVEHAKGILAGQSSAQCSGAAAVHTDGFGAAQFDQTPGDL